jgi:hypothetical protein
MVQWRARLLSTHGADFSICQELMGKSGAHLPLALQARFLSPRKLAKTGTPITSALHHETGVEMAQRHAIGDITLVFLFQ